MFSVPDTFVSFRRDSPSESASECSRCNPARVVGSRRLERRRRCELRRWSLSWSRPADSSRKISSPQQRGRIAAPGGEDSVGRVAGHTAGRRACGSNHVALHDAPSAIGTQRHGKNRTQFTVLSPDPFCSLINDSWHILLNWMGLDGTIRRSFCSRAHLPHDLPPTGLC